MLIMIKSMFVSLAIAIAAATTDAVDEAAVAAFDVNAATVAAATVDDVDDVMSAGNVIA